VSCRARDELQRAPLSEGVGRIGEARRVGRRPRVAAADVVLLAIFIWVDQAGEDGIRDGRRPSSTGKVVVDTSNSNRLEDDWQAGSGPSPTGVFGRFLVDGVIPAALNT